MSERESSTATEVPRTRSMHRVVEACEDVEQELGFQIRRLNEHVTPRTEEEKEYFDNLKAGYEGAKRWIAILRRYQQGRLDRTRAGEPAPDRDAPSIDEDGTSGAYLE